MRFLGNLIWLIFGGFFAAVGYILGGLALCLTVIGIPFGLQSIKVGWASLTPFGKELETDPDISGPLHVIFNILWIVLFGWEIAMIHLTSAGVLAITIVGVPFALQHLKLVPLALFPFGMHLR